MEVEGLLILILLIDGHNKMREAGGWRESRDE